MQLVATEQSVAVDSFMRLLAPPEPDSHRPSSDDTVYGVPLVHRNVPPLHVAPTVPPAAGSSAPKPSVDVAVFTTQVPVTLAETVITCVPPAAAWPAAARAVAATAARSDI